MLTLLWEIKWCNQWGMNVFGIRQDIDKLSFQINKPVSKGLYKVEFDLMSKGELILKTENGFLVGDLSDMNEVLTKKACGHGMLSFP